MGRGNISLRLYCGQSKRVCHLSLCIYCWLALYVQSKEGVMVDVGWVLVAQSDFLVSRLVLRLYSRCPSCNGTSTSPCLQLSIGLGPHFAFEPLNPVSKKASSPYEVAVTDYASSKFPRHLPWCGFYCVELKPSTDILLVLLSQFSLSILSLVKFFYPTGNTVCT